LGLDVDPIALELAREHLESFGERAILVRASYTGLSEQLDALGWVAVDGILLDLGMSSMQVDAAERGFSFLEEGPLDMRFDPDQPLRAADLVNDLSVSELADLIYRYGEEKRSRQVARAIASARPLHTTLQLAQVVAKAVTSSRGARRRDIHPATRTFQALRIAVNGELEAIEAVLPQAVAMLGSGGRLAVIALSSSSTARRAGIASVRRSNRFVPAGIQRPSRRSTAVRSRRRRLKSKQTRERAALAFGWQKNCKLA
jgi:16S rRNA (cytosine1402-N4)-methyltransferase